MCSIQGTILYGLPITHGDFALPGQGLPEGSGSVHGWFISGTGEPWLLISWNYHGTFMAPFCTARCLQVPHGALVPPLLVKEEKRDGFYG